MSMLDRPIPIFPLPNCVLLPGGLQGLHIFEPRYRCMIADELYRPEHDRLIAMVLLKPGYEPFYCTHQAPIHPALCVGRMVNAERMEDGRFNILLLGKRRVSILKEMQDRSYRRGLLESLETINDLFPEEETSLQNRLISKLPLLPEELACVAREIITRQADLEAAVDLLTFHLLIPEAAPAKQMILAEPRLDYRAKMLITLIERGYAQSTPQPAGLSQWPPSIVNN